MLLAVRQYATQLSRYLDTKGTWSKYHSMRAPPVSHLSPNGCGSKSPNLLPSPRTPDFTTRQGRGNIDGRARRMILQSSSSSAPIEALGSSKCESVPNYGCICCYTTSLLAADPVFP